jgi:hypothetical protein
MRQRFGQHLTDGIAGENILIDGWHSDEPECSPSIGTS